MIRKLVFPALAAALLSGCVTDYAYRGGDRGDYYYGRPSVEYRYDGGYGGYSPYYGYGGYGPRGFGYPYPYGARYGHGGYFNHGYYPPYYGPYLQRPPVVQPRHDDRDDRRPPWRNFDELRRRQSSGGDPSTLRPRAVGPAGPAFVEPRQRGSRMEQIIRRANRNAEPGTTPQEP